MCELPFTLKTEAPVDNLNCRPRSPYTDSYYKSINARIVPKHKPLVELNLPWKQLFGGIDQLQKLVLARQFLNNAFRLFCENALILSLSNFTINKPCITEQRLCFRVLRRPDF